MLKDDPRASSTATTGVVLFALAAVVAWRLIALLLLRAQPEATSLLVRSLLAGLGLTFLVCGLLVFLKIPGRGSLLFVAFCICSGLHWGGPLALAVGELRTGLLLFYLLVSGILGATFLLHLALEFPQRSRLADRRAVVGLVYAPVALAAVAMALAVASPSENALRTTAQQGFLLTHTIVSNLFSVLALVLFAGHLFRSGLSTTRKRYVGLMVVGMLTAWLPYIIASSLGVVDTDPWNFTVVALPLSFAVAFFGGNWSRASKPLASLVLFALLTTVHAPAAAENSVDVLVPSESCRGLFIVPVTFGEAPDTTLDLLLDTGSSWTLIDPRAMRKLVGGEIRAGKMSFRSARIGSYELGPLQASALSMRDVSLAVGRDLDGILGFPALQDVLLTLDYPAQEVRISSGSLPSPDGHEIFRVSGKRPHLAMTGGGRRFKVLIDSGATGRFELRRSDVSTWSVEPRLASISVGTQGAEVHHGGRVDGTFRVGPLDFEDPLVILRGDERRVGWQVLRHFVLTFDQRLKRMRMRADSGEPVRMEPLARAGLAYHPRPEGLRVVKVFPGTSAEAAGLRAGDLIVAIDGTPVARRECGDSVDTAGQRQVFSYIRDGVPSEATVETEVLIP